MRVAVLGLGEAGALYAADMAGKGWTVTGYDPADNPTPPGVLRARTPAEAVADAEAVLSLVGHAAARRAAESVAADLGPGAFYADMNAGDPAGKLAVAELVGAHRYADVSIMAPVVNTRAASNLVVSGPASSRAAEAFRALGAAVEDIGGAPGDASARKLLRSTFMKGLAALIVESSDAARAAGAEPWVRAQIANALVGGDAAVERLYTGTRKHAARRAAEVADAAALVESLGLRPVMARATRDLHATCADRPLVPTGDLLAEFAGLPVANIGDARDRMGMLDGGVHTLWKGARAVGWARTVWTRAGDNAALHRAIAQSRDGDVLVVNGEGDTTRALMGDLMAEKAKLKGVRGVVVDGAVRDIEGFEHLGLGVWARAVTPAGPYKNGPGQVGVPVAVGGVAVQNGDLIVADDDGVIVVPAAEAASCLIGGRAVEAEEARRRELIRAGAV